MKNVKFFQYNNFESLLKTVDSVNKPKNECNVCTFKRFSSMYENFELSKKSQEIFLLLSS